MASLLYMKPLTPPVMSSRDTPEHSLQDSIIFQGNEIVRLRDEIAMAQVRATSSAYGSVSLLILDVVIQDRVRALRSQNVELLRSAAVQRASITGTQSVARSVPGASTRQEPAIASQPPSYNGRQLRVLKVKKLKHLRAVAKVRFSHEIHRCLLKRMSALSANVRH